MRMFNISASVGCHKGNKRKNNEDNFYLNGVFKEDPNEKKNLFSAWHNTSGGTCRLWTEGKIKSRETGGKGISGSVGS